MAPISVHPPFSVIVLSYTIAITGQRKLDQKEFSCVVVLKSEVNLPTPRLQRTRLFDACCSALHFIKDNQPSRRRSFSLTCCRNAEVQSSLGDSAQLVCSARECVHRSAWCRLTPATRLSKQTYLKISQTIKYATINGRHASSCPECLTTMSTRFPKNEESQSVIHVRRGSR